jgi:hypothetical protein
MLIVGGRPAKSGRQRRLFNLLLVLSGITVKRQTVTTQRDSLIVPDAAISKKWMRVSFDSRI